MEDLVSLPTNETKCGGKSIIGVLGEAMNAKPKCSPDQSPFEWRDTNRGGRRRARKRRRKTGRAQPFSYMVQPLTSQRPALYRAANPFFCVSAPGGSIFRASAPRGCGDIAGLGIRCALSAPSCLPSTALQPRPAPVSTATKTPPRQKTKTMRNQKRKTQNSKRGHF